MATALLGLGSNLGDRAAALEKAIELLKAEPQIRVAAVSSFRSSKPAGGPEGQGEFINAAARLETSLAPEELLAKILAIEDQVGRVRAEHWGPRVIDLDLLLYDLVEMKTPTLELPHPRMCYRRFVLEPAVEIAPDMMHPLNETPVHSLLFNLEVRPRYIALGGLNTWQRHADLDALEQHPGVVPIRAYLTESSKRADPGIVEQSLLQTLADETDAEVKMAVLYQFRKPLNAIDTMLSDQWCISNYWYEQLRADAAFLYAEPPSLYLFDMISVLPRLLVLDDSVAVTDDYRDGLSRYNDKMRSLIKTYELAVLRVDQESDTVSEVLAAMQAME